MEHTKHIWRAVIILVAFMLIAVIGRSFIVPESFGVQGHFRFDSIQEYMDKPVIHGINKQCRKCHKEEYTEHKKGKHAPVLCETCHGPLAAHADDEEKTGDALISKKTRSADLCALCHQKLEARPRDFPQLDFLDHVNEPMIDAGLPPLEKYSKRSCFRDCHTDTHSPRSD